ncbi:MAG: class I SAM-dependent methyltransferase [Nitrososphaerota archaeon]|nr:class I SAM-dependent methyltransferase [Nitrososphaerota archaeon]
MSETPLTAWKTKRSMMKRYDITAEIYDERYFEEQNRKYKKALENVGVKGLSILDVGCGSGLFFSHVAEQAMLVVGVDVSHGLLLKAKERPERNGNVFLVQADADHLPFRDNFFGATFAFTMLQNVPNPSETITELKRVVEVNGKVVVTGLKKAFALNKFMDILEDSKMTLTAFVDEKTLNCYVAVLGSLSISTSAASPLSA